MFEGCTPRRFTPVNGDALTARPGAVWMDAPADPARSAGPTPRVAPGSAHFVARGEGLYIALIGRIAERGAVEEGYAFISAADVVGAPP